MKESTVLFLQMIPEGVVIFICLREMMEFLKYLNITRMKLKINLTKRQR